MPHFDFKFRGEARKQKHYSVVCFAQFFRKFQDVEKISVYAFPLGKRKPNGELGAPVEYGYSTNKDPKGLLSEFNTEEMLGVERYAKAMAFIPGTSFVPDYKLKKEIFENTPMCQFRFEEKKDVHVSAVIRQLWINGIRYCWEEPYTKFPCFVLTYFKPEMTKLELFNLHLLAHHTIDEDPTNHSSNIKNPMPFTQDEFDKLMANTAIGQRGTQQFDKTNRDPHTYKNIVSEISKEVKNALKKIQNGKEPPTLEELCEIWTGKKTENVEKEDEQPQIIINNVQAHLPKEVVNPQIQKEKIVKNKKNGAVVAKKDVFQEIDLKELDGLIEKKPKRKYVRKATPKKAIAEDAIVEDAVVEAAVVKKKAPRKKTNKNEFARDFRLFK